MNKKKEGKKERIKTSRKGRGGGAMKSQETFSIVRTQRTKSYKYNHC